MNKVKQYKEQLWDYSNDELKDLIAGRFGNTKEEEVAAALELLKERRGSHQGHLTLQEIPYASMPVLIEIIKNPTEWGAAAVAKAEAELLRREHSPLNNKAGETGKNIFKIILATLGLVASVILIKVVALFIIAAIIIYAVLSFLGGIFA